VENNLFREILFELLPPNGHFLSAGDIPAIQAGSLRVGYGWAAKQLFPVPRISADYRDLGLCGVDSEEPERLRC
jgi:hypothetical protein